jgi:hypothetical protein
MMRKRRSIYLFFPYLLFFTLISIFFKKGEAWPNLMMKNYNMSKFESTNFREMLEDYYVKYQFTVEESDDFEKITGHKQRSFLQTLQHVLRSEFKGPSESTSCGCGEIKMKTGRRWSGKRCCFCFLLFLFTALSIQSLFRCLCLQVTTFSIDEPTPLNESTTVCLMSLK